MNQNDGSKETLSVIMPVYNEQDAISGVIESWHQELSRLGIEFRIHAYNDGSRDSSLQALNNAAARVPSLTVHSKPNSGHGPTILLGYRENLTAMWLFQVDSDDELKPADFEKLWSRRESFDFLIGQREGRVSPLPRKIISLISRFTIRALYGPGVWDVNSPFRLFRSSFFHKSLMKIPTDTFAPNLILSAEAGRLRARIFETPVTHFERQTGEVSIKKWRLFKAALKSFKQTIVYRFDTSERVRI